MWWPFSLFKEEVLLPKEPIKADPWRYFQDFESVETFPVNSVGRIALVPVARVWVHGINIDFIFDGRDSKNPVSNKTSYRWYLNEDLITQESLLLIALNPKLNYKIRFEVWDHSTKEPQIVGRVWANIPLADFLFDHNSEED